MEKNIFELATRNKYRFPFRGSISTEDLWDLSVENLDLVFKTLNAQVKASNEESLLATKSAEDETLDNMIAIVKYIVSVKIEEANKRKQAKEVKEKKQKIAAIIAAKQDAVLNDMSINDLQAMLNGLDN